jgi:GNAT superfamily N-acetyltransferase
MDTDTYSLIYEAYETKEFEDYFRFDGMQQIDLKGNEIPMFTLMQPLKPFDLHSSYTGRTLMKNGVKVPEKYLKKQVNENELPSIFDILDQIPLDTATKELKDIEIETVTLVDNNGNLVKGIGLKSIAVRPEYAGKGILSKIMDYLEKQYSNVIIYDVIHSRVKSMAEKRGYELIETEDEFGNKVYHYLRQG